MSSLLALALASSLLPLQDAPKTPPSKLSSATVRADFDHLYRALGQAHFNLYAHTDRKRYDLKFAELRKQIKAPMTRIEVIRLFQELTAYGRVGHARIDFPAPEYVEYVKGGGKLFPLDIAVRNGRAYVLRSYSKNKSVSPGTEVLSLDGKPFEQTLNQVRKLVSGETLYMVDSQLETMFPRLLWLQFGERRSYRLVVRDRSGKKIIVQLSAEPAIEVEPAKSDYEPLTSREFRILNDRIAYLRPGPFFEPEGADSMNTEKFTKFIDRSFQQMLEKGSTDLIIDIRNNPGGDNSFSDPMIAWFAARPFRFCSSFKMKASPQLRQKYYKPESTPAAGSFEHKMRTALSTHKDGRTFDFHIEIVPPRSQPQFKGKVYVLVNRHSYSNCATVAALVQDFKLATLCGEETADLPTSYAASEQFELPRTKVAVTYPKAFFVRPNGKISTRGAIPDLSIPSPLVPAKGDPVLEDLKAHIVHLRR